MSKATKEDLVNSLINFKEKYGVIPRSVDCIKYEDLFSVRTYRRSFGTFNNALIAAGFPANRLRRDMLDKKCDHCGKSYSTKEQSSKYCCTTCANRDIASKRNVPTKDSFCKECGCSHSRNSEFCSQICRSTFEMKSISIGEASKYSQQNRYRSIRDKGNNFYKHYGKSSECEHCGYSKHTENCHIRPVSDFEDGDTVWDCNKPDNMVFLCRNCHWELDNGILTIEEIRDRH